MIDWSKVMDFTIFHFQEPKGPNPISLPIFLTSRQGCLRGGNPLRLPTFLTSRQRCFRGEKFSLVAFVVIFGATYSLCVAHFLKLISPTRFPKKVAAIYTLQKWSISHSRQKEKKKKKRRRKVSVTWWYMPNINLIYIIIFYFYFYFFSKLSCFNTPVMSL